jgi:hypothetical protein
LYMRSRYLVKWKIRKSQNSKSNNVISKDKIEKKIIFKKETPIKKLESTLTHSTNSSSMTWDWD